jgi:hypothetical protein
MPVLEDAEQEIPELKARFIGCLAVHRPWADACCAQAALKSLEAELDASAREL